MEELILKTPEHKSLLILDDYKGSNNYILNLKNKKQNSKSFTPTRTQAEYIINFHGRTPKVAKKWVKLDSYFSKKMMEDKMYTKEPTEIYVEKLLVEKEKSYHIWGKVFSGDTLHDFWMPKSALIKNNEIKNVVIEYSKYEHRAPMTHQKEAIEKLVRNKKFILADDMGLGKFLPINTPVYTPKGTKKIGDIKIGDKVIGSDGKSHNVIGVFPQGLKESYKITFNDGFSILSGDEHLWSVSSPNYGKNRKNERLKKSLVLSTKQMYEGGKIKVKGINDNKNREYEIETYYKSPNGNNKWQIPIVKPIQFEQNDILPIDPYLLGIGLGDGSFNKKNIRFSVHKDDYDGLFVLLNLKENKPQGNKRNGYINVGLSLYVLGIEHTRSINKFIPEIYKYSSIENRLSILQGLMDTDGHCMFNGNETFLGTEFCTISKQLCDDVVEVVQTLGGIARVKTCIPTYTYKGEKKKGKLAYRVNIKLPSGMNPFKLKRKADKYIEPKKYPTGRYIKNIEKVGFEDSVCISVDSPDKLYVTEHCIVTHNTTSTIIAALETGAKKILIVCPASLKINWQREIENYSDRSVYISEGKKFSDEHDFVIINYDILKNFHDIKKKDDSIILKTKFDLVIMDEAHMISNPQANRTKIVNDIISKIERVWLLSGTPMTSRPMNYYNLLNIVDNPVAANWMAYAIRYCNGFQFSVGKRKIWNVQGATNLEELRERTQTHILRRLKDEVLDLPEKIITPVYLRLLSKEYEELMGEYYDWYDKNPNESSSLTIQFGKLMKVRKIIAQEKIKTTIELAENIIEQGKKVIIFTNFTDTLQQIYQHFGKSAVYLDGSCSKPHRQNSVDEFQTNDKIMVFVGNLKAAGVGLTLTAAEAVIMNDLSFVPAEHAQAEDRSHRIGQKNSTSVYYPLFENTIEGAIYDILNKKKKIISTVMGDDLLLDDASSIENMLKMIYDNR
jgi:hypothetical protein